MHLRISRVRRGNKTYEYAQLVESFRRPTDGMPAHRVVASLGACSETEIANLRAALEASRQGKRVFLAKDTGTWSPVKPTESLRYLDVAVCLELWRQWELDRHCQELMPVGEALVSPADVVASLVIHRCVDPGSKLHAQRWFPRTALPELLGISAQLYNNTRLHRVLEELDAVTERLMGRLPGLYLKREGALHVLYLDITDAHFVGQGPKLAEKAKTKKKVVARKIGIALLCNEYGYPLRWAVIPGRRAEPKAMLEMVRSIHKLAWVGHAPLVMDRAMGKTAYLQELVQSGLPFLTALTRPEFPAYTDAIPWRPFANLSPGPGTEDDRAMRSLGQQAVEAGMKRVSEDLFVLDLGTLTHQDISSDGASDRGGLPEASAEHYAARALKLVREIGQAVQSGQAPSLAAAARARGLTVGQQKRYRPLTRLPEAIQIEILEGRAPGLSIEQLRRLSRLTDPARQQAAFEEMVVEVGRTGPRCTPPTSDPTPDMPATPLRVRGVAYFNPRLFLDMRRHAQRRLADVEVFVRQLNTKLRSPRSKHTPSSIAAAVDRKLRSFDLVSAFDLRIDREEGGYRVTLSVKPEEWNTRRRYDGFCLLVGHPELTQTAEELCRLYREKDTVEKDFQVIHSLIRMRPFWHATDPKVRAHVTLCMLALLLERSLKRQLGGAYTSTAALELLADCRLNRYQAPAGQGAYTVTSLDANQEAILRKLGLNYLGDDSDMLDRIAPR
jgi:hypothetical protein